MPVPKSSIDDLVGNWRDLAGFSQAWRTLAIVG